MTGTGPPPSVSVRRGVVLVLAVILIRAVCQPRITTIWTTVLSAYKSSEVLGVLLERTRYCTQPLLMFASTPLFYPFLLFTRKSFHQRIPRVFPKFIGDQTKEVDLIPFLEGGDFSV